MHAFIVDVHPNDNSLTRHVTGEFNKGLEKGRLYRLAPWVVEGIEGG